MLAKADGVLVSVLGGPDLSLADVQRAVEPISRAAGKAHVIMGAAIDDAYQGKLSITVIAASSIVPRRAVTAPAPVRSTPASVVRPGEMSLYRNPKATIPAPAEPSVPPAEPPPAPTPPKKTPAKPMQETLPLEKVSRGQFEKSEPTVYNGEDLDVPTYLRRGINLRK